MTTANVAGWYSCHIWRQTKDGMTLKDVSPYDIKRGEVLCDRNGRPLRRPRRRPVR